MVRLKIYRLIVSQLQVLQFTVKSGLANLLSVYVNAADFATLAQPIKINKIMNTKQSINSVLQAKCHLNI